MRRHRCDRCLGEVGFEAATCPHCAAALGYLCEEQRVRVLEPCGRQRFRVAGPGASDAAMDGGWAIGDPATYWRCLNAAWGCSWMLPADAGDVWCRSCRLTRRRPDTSDLRAVRAWMATEAAKRRLVYQLDSLGLPIAARSPQLPTGLAFDLVHLPGEPAVTGYLAGVITVDLTEADDEHRAAVRGSFGEALRTLIGHLRHEVGHHFMPDPVADPSTAAWFRPLFGDERADYAAALARHHAAPSAGWRDDGFISAYASAHPAEDWAECFAHYLHIADGAETAAAHQLGFSADPVERFDDPVASWPDRVQRWRRLCGALDALAAGLGQAPLYPVDLSPAALAKLGAVDRWVQTVVQRAS